MRKQENQQVNLLAVRRTFALLCRPIKVHIWLHLSHSLLFSSYPNILIMPLVPSILLSSSWCAADTFSLCPHIEDVQGVLTHVWMNIVLTALFCCLETEKTFTHRIIYLFVQFKITQNTHGTQFTWSTFYSHLTFLEVCFSLNESQSTTYLLFFPFWPMKNKSVLPLFFLFLDQRRHRTQ